MGGNAAMESIVSLSNHLQRMVKRQQGARPSAATLNRLFAAYQTERIERVRYMMNFSGLISKMQAQVTPWHRIANNWVLPLLPDRGIANRMKPYIAAGLKLEYVPVTADFKRGLVPWQDEEEDARRMKGKGQKPQLKLAGAAPASSGLVQMMRGLGIASVVAFILYAARNTPLIAAVQH